MAHMDVSSPRVEASPMPHRSIWDRTVMSPPNDWKTIQEISLLVTSNRAQILFDDAGDQKSVAKFAVHALDEPLATRERLGCLAGLIASLVFYVKDFGPLVTEADPHIGVKLANLLHNSHDSTKSHAAWAIATLTDNVPNFGRNLLSDRDDLGSVLCNLLFTQKSSLKSHTAWALASLAAAVPGYGPTLVLMEDKIENGLCALLTDPDLAARSHAAWAIAVLLERAESFADRVLGADENLVPNLCNLLASPKTDCNGAYAIDKILVRMGGMEKVVMLDENLMVNLWRMLHGKESPNLTKRYALRVLARMVKKVPEFGEQMTVAYPELLPYLGELKTPKIDSHPDMILWASRSFSVISAAVEAGHQGSTPWGSAENTPRRFDEDVEIDNEVEVRVKAMMPNLVPQAMQLERAVSSLIQHIPGIEQQVYHCKQAFITGGDVDISVLLHYGLTVDQAAAIRLYTYENPAKPEASMYYALNKALRSQNSQLRAPFNDYMRLFFYALDRLPQIHSDKLYRGITGTLYLEDYKRGKVGVWWGMTSAFTTAEAVQAILGSDPTADKTVIEMKIKSAHAVDISPFAANHQVQVLLKPGFRFTLESDSVISPGLYLVKVVECV